MVRNYGARELMQPHNVMNKQLNNLFDGIRVSEWNEMTILGEPIYYYHDSVKVMGF